MNDSNSNPSSSDRTRPDPRADLRGDSRGDSRSEARPVGEEQLLDWIDGRLPASEMARLEASSGRQGLGERVRQMQANRRAMRSMPLEKAPPELMDRVVQALERELVLGWQDGNQPNDAAAASRAANGTMVEELETIAIEEYRAAPAPWLPRLAMAAGVALLLAGGAYWAVLITAPPANRSTGPIADAGSTTEPPGIEIASRQGTNSSADQAAPQGAAAAQLAPDDQGLLVAATTSAADASLSKTLVASGPESFTLASQGRLVLRVLGGRGHGHSRLAYGLASSSPQWSLSRDVPADVALAVLASRLVPDANPELEGPALPPMMVASAEARRLLTPLMGPASAFTNIAPRPQTLANLAKIKSTLILDVAATEEALEEARAGLARQLDAEVVLERVPLAITIPASTDPSRVLWWTKSPTTWTPTLRIPVVVETKTVTSSEPR